MEKRENSFDIMRIIAIIGVIIIHVSATTWYTNTMDTNWLINNFINGLVHSWSVPLFIVISGALLLNKDISIRQVFTKYIPRILLCLIIWHLIYYFYTTRIFTFKSLLLAFYSLSYGKVYSHLWYLYLLIGIYLLLPLLCKLVQNIKKSELQYLLIIMGLISIVIPTIESFFNINLTKFIDQYKVLNFTQYIFFFILGYYLNKYSIKNKKISVILLAIVIMANILTAWYSNYISLHTHEFTNYAFNYGILGMISVIGIFTFVKLFSNNKDNKIITTVGKLTFGIYLVHFLIINVFTKFSIQPNMVNPLLGNILVLLLVSIISLIISYIISKIPYIKKTIGL